MGQVTLAHYDLNVAHILVNTNLETPLKSTTREDAITEVKVLCSNTSEGYDWKIQDCDEDSINEFDETLKKESLINFYD
jgi:hypothetical protein